MRINLFLCEKKQGFFCCFRSCRLCSCHLRNGSSP
jgi:hypothetical protein